MECGLCDLGHRGVPFTCTNRRFKEGLVKGRLDRFLCSEQWRNIFSNILVAHMAARGSDYLPIWIEYLNFTNRGRSLETEEEDRWRQPSRAVWVKEGDRNTRCFHARASVRRREIGLMGCWIQTTDGEKGWEIEKAQVRSYGGNTGHFLQLRVIIDVTKPLRKCVKLQSPNEENEGEDETGYGNVPDHGSLSSVAIPEKDNSREANLRVENKSVTGSIGLPI
ncbi:hypothetical protein WN944_010253 [Citrus x changshan-huyou]|uniref:Uncharacterized protein n=1 Tax=Citrus x changshan-huyou TaxID=2935761 RepID=A0AAP0MUJ5_9ROSI